MADPITADSAPAIEAAHRNKKRAQRLGKSVDAPPAPAPVAQYKPAGVASFVAPASTYAANKQPADSSSSSTKKTTKSKSKGKEKEKVDKVEALDFVDDSGLYDDLDLGDLDDGLDGAGAGDEDEEAAALARRTKLAAKIMDYYREFPFTRPGGEKQKTPPSWSAMSAETKLDAEYTRIKFLMDSRASKETVRSMFVKSMTLAERVVTDVDKGGWGINPLDLNLEGLGQACSLNVEMFEPELTEASIELRDWLSASWEKRLAFKAVGFVAEYSKLKSNPEYMEAMKRAQELARQQASAASHNTDDL